MMPNREGWGRDLTIAVHLVNGEVLRKTIAVEDLIAEAGDNLFAIRRFVAKLEDMFMEFRNLDYLSIAEGGKEIFINPVNVLYVSTTGFKSWETK